MGKLATTYAEKRGFNALLHLVYWILAWSFLNLFFGYGELMNRFSMYYSLSILLITAGVTYWATYYLIPRYLFKGRYGLFIIYFLFTIIASLDLELITVWLFLIYVEKFQLLMLDYNTRDIYSLLAGTYFIVFLSVGIKLTGFWFHEKSRRQAAQKEKIESELKLLKSQIHPHFLFNTLNNIYALTLQKSDQAPEAIIKLSELLDYLIYQGENELVPLAKEIELIDHYMLLEKLRYGNRLDASFEKTGDPKKVMIAPVLLLPFVENAFKHGISQSRNKVRLKILLEISNGSIIFHIENSKPSAYSENFTQGGIGLENLKRRLEILYKDRYSLEINDKEDIYSVNLKLTVGDKR
jgi:sensor histidine kinase YesM